MTEKIVIVLERNDQHDLTDAKRYGDVHFLFERGDARPSIFSHAFLDECYKRMAMVGYQPARDFVAISGSITLVALLVTDLVSRNEDVNLLFFDAKNNEYVHKLIN